MKILYVDLSPGIGGSLLSLERLLSRLDRAEFEPVMALAAQNPAAPRFHDLGVPVQTVPTFVVTASGAAPGVRQGMDSRSGSVRAWPKPEVVPGRTRADVRQRLRGGWLTRPTWSLLRSTRNVLTRTIPLTWRMYRIIRAIQPDLVHINDAIFVNRPVLAAAWLGGTPAVCHVRSLGTLGKLDRLWARTVRRFIFISQWVARDLAAQGIPEDRGRLIYDGLDMSSYTGLPDRAVACAVLGVSPDRPTVAVVGRLVPWKGQDLFLRAMRIVADAMPEAQGLIVGEVESYARDFGYRLRELSRELGLDAAVHFVGHITDVPQVYAAIDVLAHTSVTPEPFGLVMIEAMAAGLPVVTPAEGGGQEIVADGETGRHFEPRIPYALAMAILDLLRDPARARTMGSAGRERVRQAFTLDHFVAAMTAFYHELPLKRGRLT